MSEPTRKDDQAGRDHGSMADHATPDDTVKTIPADEYTKDDQ